MIKAIIITVILNLILTISFPNIVIASYASQQNSEITYKEAMNQISILSYRPVEEVIIEDKLEKKMYNYLFENDNVQFNYIKMESEKNHEENEELKATWLGILKVDYGNKLIVDMYATAVAEQNLLNKYEFKLGSWGCDKDGNNINGYYDNVYTSGIVEFINKKSYEHYYFYHDLSFSF